MNKSLHKMSQIYDFRLTLMFKEIKVMVDSPGARCLLKSCE